MRELNTTTNALRLSVSSSRIHRLVESIVRTESVEEKKSQGLCSKGWEEIQQLVVYFLNDRRAGIGQLVSRSIHQNIKRKKIAHMAYRNDFNDVSALAKDKHSVCYI